MNLTFRDHTFTVDGSFEHFTDEQDLIDEYWTVDSEDVVIDVGAGAGRYTLPSLAVGAYVYAVEPKQDWRLELERLAAMNGFSDHLQTDARALSNGKDPDAMLAMIEASSNEDLSPRGAVFTTLDEISVEPPATPTWIKIDVEGQELAVLQGAHTMLMLDRPTLWVEDHSRVYTALGPKHRVALVQFLQQFGYEIQAIPYDVGVPRDYLLCRPV